MSSLSFNECHLPQLYTRSVLIPDLSFLDKGQSGMWLFFSRVACVVVHSITVVPVMGKGVCP